MTGDPLRTRQEAFDAAVRDGRLAPGLLKDRADGASPLLGVYRHAYAARLVDALRENFEVLARALGDESFDRIAHAYVAGHPSTHASIRWYGADFAEFLAAQEDLVPHPAFADVARMDWAMRGAFDAPDAYLLRRDALDSMPVELWPEMHLNLQPSVRLVRLQWSIEPAWRVLSLHQPGADEEPELPVPQALEHDLLVWRVELDTHWRSVEVEEARLLRGLQEGLNFGALCTMATEDGDEHEAAARVTSHLARWLAEGLLAGTG